MMTTGLVTLISSGETAHSGGQVFDSLARFLPRPLRASVLETPAGFETNSSRVAGRVAEFLQTRLQNYQATAQLIPARKKGTPLSPDSAEIVDPLYDSDLIFFGPGSPTYTVRQLEGSLAWQVIQASQRLGAALVLASAADIAIGRYALPVYEIYKVGEDPIWKPGLDYFGPYGLSLVFVPHWNNREGGEDVDTSRCFIGQARFEILQAQLPPEVTVVGLDEHTALTIDLAQAACRVQGSGQVHLIRAGHSTAHSGGGDFPITELGPYHPLASPDEGISQAVWETAQQRRLARAQAHLAGERQKAAGSPGDGVDAANRQPGLSGGDAPDAVRRLVEARQAARQEKNYKLADRLRVEILDAGWEVKDTPEGPRISRIQE